MSETNYPTGWDADRVKRLIDHYEHLSEEEQVAEDKAALEQRSGETVISVPSDLLPTIRTLLMNRKTA